MTVLRSLHDEARDYFSRLERTVIQVTKSAGVLRVRVGVGVCKVLEFLVCSVVWCVVLCWCLVLEVSNCLVTGR